MVTTSQSSLKRLYKLEDMVRTILSENPRARDDDRELTLVLHTRFYNINPYSCYCELMRNDNIPSQESIGRCRRKIQEQDEALRGSRAKEKIRLEEQESYIEYALDDRREELCQ